MKKLKNFTAFFESRELIEVLQNPENNFIINKDGEIIAAFEYLGDIFDHIVELLDAWGEIDDDQKFDIQDMIIEELPSIDADVKEIDMSEVNEFLNKILNEFDIESRFNITNRYEKEEVETVEENVSINEDWGTSDQSIMNNTIHRDLDEPTEMPMPFDDNLRAAAENAVDDFWEDWAEYETDREGLIDKAITYYYMSHFKEKYNRFKEMFS